MVLLCILAVFMLRLPFSRLRAGWIPITLFLVFTFASNLLNHHGKVLYSAGSIFVTDAGLDAAVFRTARLGLMIGGLKVLMAGTSAGSLVDGLGRLFGPLERLGIPVKDFVHIMGLTLQCFPVLKETAADLYRKQINGAGARGFMGRARAISSFMVPMFVSSVQSPEIFFVEKKGERDV